MDRLYETLSASGNIEIWKVYEDGTDELFFSDHNIIVSGMGAGFMSLFGGYHSNDIRDYQIKYFQVGNDSYADADVTVNIGELKAPLTALQYNPSGLSNLIVSSVSVRVGDNAKTQSVAEIPWNHIRRASPNSVLYTLVLDTDAANDISLKEVGLFMRSPMAFGADTPTPMLVAYKKFPVLDKKREFSLIFKWTLYF